MSLFGQPSGSSAFGSNTAAATSSTSPFARALSTNSISTNTANPFGQPANQQQNNQQTQSNPFGGSLFGQSFGQNQQQQQQQPNAAASSFMGANQPAGAQPPLRASLIWEPGRESSHSKYPASHQAIDSRLGNNEHRLTLAFPPTRQTRSPSRSRSRGYGTSGTRRTRIRYSSTTSTTRWTSRGCRSTSRPRARTRENGSRRCTTSRRRATCPR